MEKAKKCIYNFCSRLKHLWKRRPLRYVAYIFCATASLLFCSWFADNFIFTPIKDPVYGVSFSIKQAQNLGVSWKENFIALLDDLQFKKFRLMSYWDDSEATRGEYNFSDLDWQFAEANKRGAKISLAIGLRQPRWPECHQPDWAEDLSYDEWKQALYAYMQTVVNRYKDNPALESYQLENEGLNNWFGECTNSDRDRLIEEYNLVKQWDPTHEIIMGLSDEHGLALGDPVPDVYGFSVYQVVWNDKFIIDSYVTYPTPIWYHRLRAALITAVQNRPVIIHELQMEPWGTADTKYLSIEEQNKSMSVEQIAKNFKFARKIGIKEMYLWGGEWWYWRMENGDPSIWEAVRQQLQTED